MKKYLLIVWLLVCAPFGVFSQAEDYFIPLNDISGYVSSQSQLEALENASRRLIDSLPAIYKDSFKVYDFGFYLQNENMFGGYPEIFQLAIMQVQAQSRYYLLFGKQTDKTGVYTKFWIDLNLPNGDIFYCIDQLGPSLRNDLVSKYRIIANSIHNNNAKSHFRYHEAEIATIDSLRAYISALKECCVEANQRGMVASCTACIFTQQEFSSMIENLGLLSYEFSKIIDSTYYRNGVEDIGYLVIDNNNDTIDLDAAMADLKYKTLLQFPDVTIKIYPFNYIGNCTDFLNIRNSCINGFETIGILIGVIGENNGAGKVYWQMMSNDDDENIVNKKHEKINKRSNDYVYYFDEIGKYNRKEHGVGPMGVWVNKRIQGVNYEFTFADVITTPQTLTDAPISEVPPFDEYGITSEPLLNRAFHMNRDIILTQLSASKVFEPHLFPPWSLYKGSSGWSGLFDFSTKDFYADRKNRLFITDNIYGNPGYLDGIGHNYRNMGNFLWGAATYIMGVNKYMALAGAHLNNLCGSNWSEFDSPDDQWSIQLGRMYAKKREYRRIATAGRGNFFKNW